MPRHYLLWMRLLGLITSLSSVLPPMPPADAGHPATCTLQIQHQNPPRWAGGSIGGFFAFGQVVSECSQDPHQPAGDAGSPPCPKETATEGQGSGSQVTLRQPLGSGVHKQAGGLAAGPWSSGSPTTHMVPAPWDHAPCGAPPRGGQQASGCPVQEGHYRLQ